MDLDQLEKQIFKCLIEYQPYAECLIQANWILPDYFESPAVAKGFQVVRDHYQEYRKLPTYEIAIQTLNDNDFNSLVTEVKAMNFDFDSNLRWFDDNCKEFFDDQFVKKRMREAVDNIEQNNRQGLNDIILPITESSSRIISGGVENKLLNARDLSVMVFEQLNFIVPDLLPTGLALLCGKPKQGKSWMCYNLWLNLASGGHLFGRYPINKCSTLYLALEDRGRRSQNRINQLLAGGDVPDNAYIAFDVPRLGAGLIQYLERQVKKHPDIRLIIIDTLELIAPEFKRKSSRQNNVYTADYQKMTPLKKFADDNNLCVLAVHHFNKRENDSDPIDLVSGSTGLTGAVDTIIGLNRKVKQADARLYFTGRDIEENELAIMFDSGWWKYVGNAEEYDTSPLEHMIISYLPKEPEHKTTSEIIAGITGSSGYTEKYIKNALGKLVTEGKIQKPKRGQYSR